MRMPCQTRRTCFRQALDEITLQRRSRLTAESSSADKEIRGGGGGVSFATDTVWDARKMQNGFALTIGDAQRRCSRHVREAEARLKTGVAYRYIPKTIRICLLSPQNELRYGDVWRYIHTIRAVRRTFLGWCPNHDACKRWASMLLASRVGSSLSLGVRAPPREETISLSTAVSRSCTYHKLYKSPGQERRETAGGEESIGRGCVENARQLGLNPQGGYKGK